MSPRSRFERLEQVGTHCFVLFFYFSRGTHNPPQTKKRVRKGTNCWGSFVSFPSQILASALRYRLQQLLREAPLLQLPRTQGVLPQRHRAPHHLAIHRSLAGENACARYARAKFARGELADVSRVAGAPPIFWGTLGVDPRGFPSRIRVILVLREMQGMRNGMTPPSKTIHPIWSPLSGNPRNQFIPPNPDALSFPLPCFGKERPSKTEGGRFHSLCWALV